MAKGYLLDTNAIIDFSAKRLSHKGHEFIADVIDGSPQISVINKIELLGFIDVPQQIVNFIDAVFVINLTDEIVTQTIALRKKYKIKLPDAIIAATSLTFNLILVTNNLNDFKNIQGLELLNPYSIS